jgi:glutamate/tyrosine decarboxylase-like PLP-dependent enzyme
MGRSQPDTSCSKGTESIVVANPQRYERAFALLREHLEREQSEPIARYRSPRELLEELDLGLESEGVDDDAMFAQLSRILERTPRTTTTRFFNQLFGGRGEFGTIGEVLAAFLNSSMYTFKAGGPQVLIEQEVTSHMARLAGFEEGEGLFTPGGSMSNLVGMLLARNARHPQTREEGMGARRMTLYVSELCHYSIPKNAGIMGLGRENARPVATDERGRMRPDALRAAIASDLRDGHEPFLIVGTCGTTVLGAFDPVAEIADIAQEHELWLHLDAALGGSLLLSEKGRDLMRGCDRADSMTWNAHKLLGVPLPASTILTRKKGQLYESLCQKASYLFQSDEDEYDLGTQSIQCGRRNDALKLWATWKSQGDQGLARRVDRLIELAQYAAARVRGIEGLMLSKDPESVTVCFEVEGKRSDEICELLRREQRELVGYGIVDGRRVIRLACVNDDVDESDLDTFFVELLEVAQRAGDGDNSVGKQAVTKE